MRKSLVGLTSVLSLCAVCVAQRPQKPVTVEQVSPDVYWVKDGGFAAFIVGDKGVIAIDTGGSPTVGKTIVDDIAKVTDKPINTLILSHCDADHINGSNAFPAGIPVYAQAENRKWIEHAVATGMTGAEAPVIAPDHMPNHSVATKEVVTIDGVKLQLLHFGAGHTSGDLIVYIPSEKLVLAGDALVGDQHDLPLIHREDGKGGSSKGWIESVRGLLALDADRYIIGHEAIVGKDGLQKQLDTAIAERTKIKELYDKGVSLEDIETAVNDPLASTKGQPRHFPPYSEVVYTELKEGTY